MPFRRFSRYSLNKINKKQFEIYHGHQLVHSHLFFDSVDSVDVFPAANLASESEVAVPALEEEPGLLALLQVVGEHVLVPRFGVVV